MAKYGELEKGLRTATKRELAAQAQGDHAKAKQYRAIATRFARALKNDEYEEESHGVASALQGFSQGATFGFADELGAGARASVIDPIFGGLAAGFGLGGYKPSGEGRGDNFWDRMRDYQENFTSWGERSLGESYKENLGSQRAALETARREDPWTTGLAEFTGGLGTGGIGAVKTVAGQGLLKGASRLIPYGGAVGAVAGYGQSEADPLSEALLSLKGDKASTGYQNAMSELKGAFKDAGVGAVFGGTLSFAMPFIGAGLRTLSRTASNLFTRKARLDEHARKAIASTIEDDVALGTLNIDDALSELKKNPHLTVGDLSPGLQKIVEDIAQTTTKGGFQLRNMLTKRAESEYERVMPHLTTALGGKPGDGLAHVMRTIQSTAKRQADEAFNAAYEVPTEITPIMHDVLTKTPLGKRAANALQLEFRNLQRELPEFGDIGDLAQTQNMHTIMQAMDGVVSRAFKTQPYTVADSYKKAAQAFKDEVLNQNKPFRQARTDWGTAKEAEEALLAGSKVFNKDAATMDVALDALSQNGKTHYTLGVISAIDKKLSSKTDIQSLANELKSKRQVREQLRVLFGDEKKFDEFMSLLGAEKLMHTTFAKATANSATASRLAQKVSGFGERIARLLGFGVTMGAGVPVPPSIASYMAGQGYRAAGMPALSTRNVAQMLDSQTGMLAGQDIMGIMKPHTLGGLLGSGVPSTIAAGTGALAATQGAGLLE